MIELKDVQVTAETSLQMAYAAALEGFFFDPCESTPRGGYEIGRKAIAEGVGVLEIASMHHAAVTKHLLNAGDAEGSKRRLQQAEEFYSHPDAKDLPNSLRPPKTSACPGKSSLRPLLGRGRPSISSRR